jgi:gamma-glutamyl-gamma-aminobutyrate hydrolase PuuD
VQWHPEDQVQADETQLKLFRAFAEAVGRGKRAAG